MGSTCVEPGSGYRLESLLPTQGLFWEDLQAVLATIPRRAFLGSLVDSFLLELPSREHFETSRFKREQAIDRLAGLGAFDLSTLRVHVLPPEEPGSRLTVGRSRELNNLVLGDESVSQQHAVFRKTEQGWQLLDLSSSNGTFVEGTQMPPESWIPLASGRLIRFADYRAVFLSAADLYSLATTVQKPTSHPRGILISPPEGFRLKELFRCVADLDLEAFERRAPHCWLLQVPYGAQDEDTACEATRFIDEDTLEAQQRSPHAGNTRIHSLNLGATGIRLGRGKESCELVLNDPTVSRRHADLRLSPRGWALTDLGSSNGTFVEGRRLGAQESLVLRTRQIFSCGAYRALIMSPPQLHRLIEGYNNRRTRKANVAHLRRTNPE